MAIDTDIAVIGGGPAGYVGAIRAAQLGARVTLIEKEYLGGTCLNWGCIPSKALLESAHRYEVLTRADEFGLTASGIGYNMDVIQARKDKVVRQLRGGVEQLVKGNGITYLNGYASFQDAQRLQVKLADGTSDEVRAKNVIIATGSTEGRLPVEGVNLPGVFTSKEGLSLTEIPKSVIIVGAGPIGVEFATYFAAFGSQITLVEMLPRIVPLEDADISKELARQFTRRGFQIRTDSRLESIRQVEGGLLEATISNPRGSEALRAEKVMIAAGRPAFTEGLGLDRIGVELERRFVKVDSHLRTNVPGVYAAGDVVRGGLAHVGSMQCEVAVENALGHDAEMDYRGVPGVTFSSPQIASVGLTEEKARETGQTIKVGTYPWAANSKAVIQGETAGFVKVVAEARYGQILGVHMIGPEVTELIANAVQSVVMEATVEDIAQTIFAHPTLPESYKEATLDVEGRPIHVLKRPVRR
ncbi:MAG TPA: dihydrolipoyl dehydrogenase [Chloroflexota bacterium]|nr:dihydrolipoyl dehydrogenase [Chloroflexota bacterium]